MVSLVSPEYSLEIFCYRMLGHDPVSVIEAASAEITYARRLHRESTKESNFRKGSRGREYCEDLQRLIILLMNGTVPSAATPEFLAAVKPLSQQLLQKWKIGELRRVFSQVVTSHAEHPEMRVATLDQVLAEMQKNNRVCPLPNRWQELYDMLPNKERKGLGWEPSLPLILAAWWDTPALPKMLRLREHIEWAAAHSCLDEGYSFLCSLPEDEWHHIGE